MSQNISKTIKKIIKYGILLFAFLYILFPVDLLPEALLGPIGYIDDLVALTLILFIGMDIGDVQKLFGLRRK